MRNGDARAGRIGAAAGLLLSLAWAVGTPSLAHAQLIDRYFPAGLPGYGAAAGVTVATRARPEFEPGGVRLGSVVVRPTLSSGMGYTSNAPGQPGGRGSAVVRTEGSVLAATTWGRHALGGFLSFDDQRYLSASNQSATAWTAALGGTLEIGRDRLVLGAAHLDLFQTSRALEGLAMDRPGRYQVNNARASYTWNRGRLSLTPGLSVNDIRYADVFVGGTRVAQGYRDGTAVEGNVVARWELAPLRALVADLRVVGYDQIQRAVGQPSRDSTTVALLVGIDYAASAVWRVRALVGAQHRAFADPTLKPVTGPMAEASAIWSPSGLTTLTATLSRRIEDAADLSAVSYSFTGLRLAVDHELYRNLLLAGYGEVQSAEYQQRSGSDVLGGFGVAATWLMNRRLRAGLSWDWSTRRRADGAMVDEG
ncbi:MAG: outer membrane beta-barrel protein, partial [Acetobacteraceae bacterium]|nr:outer membrane beta-barrel protein [Acetobacteraceae bacterium]